MVAAHESRRVRGHHRYGQVGDHDIASVCAHPAHRRDGRPPDGCRARSQRNPAGRHCVLAWDSVHRPLWNIEMAGAAPMYHAPPCTHHHGHGG
ncbi:hypothetical protein BJ964_005360 [Actinoplanes lobatus]|uniref:Uncharacterized protein n=1 Tax=Actinoplanes lobatus TaxID=113568 RepID=A0A7W7HIM0_9ACTN|nr:hypothetical protein [Actinoplanes lobatus]